MAIGRAATTQDHEILRAGITDAMWRAGGDTDGITGFDLEFFLIQPHYPAPGGDLVKLLAVVVAVQVGGRARRNYGLGQALILAGM